MFLKIISFDLEILPLGEQMPMPDKCPILLNSVHFNYDYNYEGNKTRNLIFILINKNGKTEEHIEVQEKRIVVYTKKEEFIVNSLFELIRKNNVITGYNISGFDFPYIIDRARTLGIKDIKIGNGDSRLYYKAHTSKGFKVTKVSGMTGKIIFDVHSLIKREDASNVFKKKYNLKITTLRHVAREILGIYKLEFNVNEMIQYWNNTDDIELRNKFIDYCSRDSELALMLMCKFRLLDKFFSLAKASGRIVQEVINSMGSGVMVENLLLKRFKANDRVVPIRIQKAIGYEKEELEGAEVAEPKLGISEDIGSIDYKSLYPSLMIKYNLCCSTLVMYHSNTVEGRIEELRKLGLTENDIEIQNDELGNPYAVFVRKEKYIGIIPSILKELLGSRAAQKKEMKKYEKGTPMYYLWDATQEATKILLNSFYGYSGDDSAKIYSWFVASAVTTTGRKQIKNTWKMIMVDIVKVKVEDREFSFIIAMGDTDSSYLRVIALDGKSVSRDETMKAINMVLDKVNSTLEKPMQLDFENYIKRIIITAKKRYAYISIDDNGKESITSKGIETIRREWSNYSSDTMAKVVDFILKEKDVNEGVRKSIDLIREQIKLLNEDKIKFSDLIMSKKLTKLVYDNKQIHVAVAIKMKERGRPSEIGDRIQYIIIDNGKKLVSDKAEEADYVIKNIDKFKIDKDYYVTRQLLPPTMRILELLSVSEKMLMTGVEDTKSKQRSLFEF